MFTFDVTRHVPRFILQDKNGYAVSKAIEAAVQIMNDTIQQGVDCVLNYDTMPEWRLDELAWETNCLYDYNADLETKRRWIKNAIPLYRLFGTPQAVYRYIGSYFGAVYLEENWQYGGDPYHFRVTVEGEWTPENEAWARKAIEASKNVRSVLDDIALGSGTTIKVHGEGGLLGRFAYNATSGEILAGTIPQENTIGKTADGVFVIAAHDAQGHVFPYPQAGTRPEVNTIGAIASAQTGTDGKATAFSYSPCTDENLCGSDEI